MMLTNTEKNWATVTHIGAFGQYLFPFGNFVIPIIIWSSKKNESEFIDNNGKQCINFQLSVILYSLILGAIFVPAFFITFLSHVTFNELIHDRNFIVQDLNFSDNIGLITTGAIAIFFLVCLKIAEFFLIIQAAVKTANGENYSYPLTIKFMK
ncbi:DUF4870 domain-containing protein [Flavobacterium ammonificans]|uniref:DUF4870 domain-containing protein n=1 Tax=Flavobacterium ammonificans TaxID=1751056 RepID=A0ABM7V156_9FLAO|nr:DUF4870 domain-containing protein [Flavobacterium ammonificans]BDB52794.1 hypothetical protein GENT11_11060 [Flavobacterium ammonificans]BDB56865.1 hypothetical protein SHINM13_11610 [Flavobacterium ammonificans]